MMHDRRDLSHDAMVDLLHSAGVAYLRKCINGKENRRPASIEDGASAEDRGCSLRREVRASELNRNSTSWSDHQSPF